MENWRKLSQNYHQILFLTSPVVKGYGVPIFRVNTVQLTNLMSCTVLQYVALNPYILLFLVSVALL